MNKLYLIVALWLIALIGFVSSLDSLSGVKTGDVMTIRQTCVDSTYITISISYPNNTIAIKDVSMVDNTNGLWTYDFTDTNTEGYYDVCGISDGCEKTFCTKFYVSPNGRLIENNGSVSIGILFFLGLLALTLIIFGCYLLNKGTFVNYLGIFFICLGFVFLYWGLHLANIYATTINYSSGAGNTTTGMFKVISGFIKLAPYLVVFMVVLVILKLYKVYKTKQNNDDGWDEDKY